MMYKAAALPLGEGGVSLCATAQKKSRVTGSFIMLTL